MDALSPEIEAIVRRALDEDIGDGDVTTLCIVPAGAAFTGRLVAKQAGVIAGLQVAGLARIVTVEVDTVNLPGGSHGEPHVEAS